MDAFQEIEPCSGSFNVDMDLLFSLYVYLVCPSSLILIHLGIYLEMVTLIYSCPPQDTYC